MRAFAIALAASLAALALGVVALVIAWPFVRNSVVASINGEVRAQGVAKGAAADAVTGFLDALAARRN